ncbi:MAG: hypothetical protein QM793_06980 [Muricomes sp.]
MDIKEKLTNIQRVVPNLTVTNLGQAVEEYQEVFDLNVLMDHGWIVTLGDRNGAYQRFFYRDSHGHIINVGMHTPNQF